MTNDTKQLSELIEAEAERAYPSLIPSLDLDTKLASHRFALKQGATFATQELAKIILEKARIITL